MKRPELAFKRYIVGKEDMFNLEEAVNGLLEKMTFPIYFLSTGSTK